ncbi:glycine--tRNA ligase [Thermoproteus tenax]|uniref:glycine--tRNA ligase n=1 Tax=Thermoproteus tenax (strain ATCC 35583 / DSM 2078 / JCM 9277 / NBRC 100435 / Kra 1) TaxID=768679 RepID=G4RKX6_THETK|nr:glycine--tRNA ligase [Thermoproteus tenax]CCC82221.1 glycyl-tRNA synthetase [Thermoproteus tenax Kra 1]
MQRAEKLESIVKKRLLYWPSSEIYGGVGGFYDYGPLAVQMRRNIVEKWRRTFVLPYQDTIIEVETPIIMPEIVFKASGHLEHFTDYVVSCQKCGRRYRADHLIEEALAEKGIKLSLEGLSGEQLDEIIAKYGIKCPACGGPLGKSERFNLLFKTTIGPYANEAGYLRPETAQGMFVAFPRLAEYVGRRTPFGVAQIGRVGRNEISPRQGLIRLREFSQMEIELFFDPQNPSCPYFSEVESLEIPIVPEELVAKGNTEPLMITAREVVARGYANEWMAFFMALAAKFMKELGVPLERQKFLGKLPQERAHYSSRSYDQMVLTERFGWVEVSGHAYRTDYDLSRHAQFSGYDMALERRLKEPREIVEVRVYPNPQAIRAKYGDKMGEVIRAIQSNQQLVARLAETDRVELGDFEITRDMVFIKREVRRTDVEKFIPHVVEPSFGLDRILYVTLEHAVTIEGERTYLRLPPDIAPVAACVLPIVKRKEYVEIGRSLVRGLWRSGLTAIYDDEGTIGSRYAMCDEIGTPVAITIDEVTPQNNTVTARDRDTKSQVRIDIGMVVLFVTKILSGRPFGDVAAELGGIVFRNT